MIKKLQKKFIGITMSSVFLVLICIIFSINLVNYINVGKDVDKVTQIIADNNGKFPKPDNRIIDEKEERNDDRQLNHKVSLEAPYETRYFSALVADGEIIWSDTGNIAAIDINEASEYALEIALNKKNKGYYKNYRYLVVKQDTGMLVVCVDCTKQLNTVHSYIKWSIIISFVALAAIFLLVFLFSQKAVKPISDTYEKQKRFVTDASHELKTPLAVILADIEVIEMTSNESEWTNSIRKQVNQMTKLTQMLTNLARMDEETFKLNKTKINLSDLMEEISSEYRIVAKNKKLTYKEKIEKNITVNGDINQIKQLINILLDNAVKYSDKEIEITLKKEKSRVFINVYNTTENVKKGDNSKLFDRFYRVDEARSKQIEGFGIGLSIAESIVKHHDGKISAKSEDGKSLNITVEIE